jgi:hypothetical protein
VSFGGLEIFHKATPSQKKKKIEAAIPATDDDPETFRATDPTRPVPRNTKAVNRKSQTANTDAPSRSFCR